MSMLRNVLLLTGMCGGCLAAWTVGAVDCVESDCAALGYTMTEDVCEGPFVRCPFDTSKVICKEKKYCDDAEIGDILYSDFTCSSDVVPGKTPIAVVFDTRSRLAVGLDAPEKVMIPAVTCWDSGKVMTPEGIKNIAEKNGCSCPACDYVLSYSTEGTEAGDWEPCSFFNGLGGNSMRGVNATLSKLNYSEIDHRYSWIFNCKLVRTSSVMCDYTHETAVELYDMNATESAPVRVQIRY